MFVIREGPSRCRRPRAMRSCRAARELLDDGIWRMLRWKQHSGNVGESPRTINTIRQCTNTYLKNHALLSNRDDTRLQGKTFVKIATQSTRYLASADWHRWTRSICQKNNAQPFGLMSKITTLVLSCSCAYTCFLSSLEVRSASWLMAEWRRAPIRWCGLRCCGPVVTSA